jgi:hypothetical protein
MLLNTGDAPVPSKHGLLTTMAFQLGPEAPRQVCVFVCSSMRWEITADGSLTGLSCVLTSESRTDLALLSLDAVRAGGLSGYRGRRRDVAA